MIVLSALTVFVLQLVTVLAWMPETPAPIVTVRQLVALTRSPALADLAPLVELASLVELGVVQIDYPNRHHHRNYSKR